MKRLTYKSMMGDYGCDVEFDSYEQEKCAFRNKLGKYEDLGFSPEELRSILINYGVIKNECEC